MSDFLSIRSLCLRAACASAAVSTTISSAAAQTPTTFNACYVPSVGAVYLIKLTGLPASCLSTSHVEITWTEGVALNALQSPGIINTVSNPVDWTKLKGVPPGFADGVDANTGGTVTSVTAGAGLAGGIITTTGTLSIATNAVTNTMLANDGASLPKVSGGVMTASAGNIGLGVANPTAKLDVGASDAGIRVSAFEGGILPLATGGIGVLTSVLGVDRIVAVVGSTTTTSGIGGLFQSSGPNILMGFGGNFTDPEFRVTGTGSVFADGSYNCGLSSLCFNTGTGADVAERIDATEGLEPGDVVEIDPASPGHFHKARTRLSTLVAGIVSTAPAITLANDDLMDNDAGERTDTRPLLALVGRVAVKVTAEGGAIEVGDLLTSSATPGYAMRCPDRQSCAGAIVGKALGPLRTGRGRIQVLVTLQ
jgi:hypothetical protein